MKNTLHFALCTLHSVPLRPLDDSRGSDLKHSALCILHSALLCTLHSSASRQCR
ncbi:MAG: hypothetical protein FWH27_09215 [Planctomycetaceae bacterium]|nr:hypothetical protein [Planctomycetaceae bacterium]